LGSVRNQNRELTGRVSGNSEEAIREYRGDQNNACDHDGNTTGKTDSTGTTDYVRDYENRLTSVTLAGSGGTVTVKHDSFGRRIYKQSPNVTSVFVYDGDGLVPFNGPARQGQNRQC